MVDTPSGKKFSRYILGKTLGSGLFKVKLLYDPSTKTKYAAKICKDSLSKPALAREATILSTLNEAGVPNVIRVIDFIETKQVVPKKKTGKSSDPKSSSEYQYKAAIILELASNGTIFDYVYHDKGFEEKLARSYFKELIVTISSLHNLGYVHRDIKLENILLDDKFRLKLADFGFAKEFDERTKERMSTRLGTEYYMAPEMRRVNYYSGVKLDMFACGVSLFLLCFGRPPFFQASSVDPLYKYFNDEKPEKFWEINEKKMNDGKEYNEGLKSLITDLMMSDPTKRPTADKIFEYEWIQKEVFSAEELFSIMNKKKRMIEETSGNHEKDND